MILTATDRKFWLGQGGSDHRILALINFLHNAGYSLGLFFAGILTRRDRELLMQKFPGMALYNCEPQNMLSVDMRGVRGDGMPVLDKESDSPPELKDFRDNIVRDSFEAVVSNIHPDAIIIEYIRLAYLAESLHRMKDPPLLMIDTIDVMSARYASFCNIGIGNAHWIAVTREQERDVLEKFDVVMAIQNVDAEAFRLMGCGRRILTVKHAPPLPPPSRRRPVNLSRFSVLYLSGSDPSNVAAARFLVDEIMPLVNVPCDLLMAGYVCASFNESDVGENIKLLGPVDDVSSVYAEADMVVNPVFSGGGLKIKNVEALSFGKPVITTAAGAAGIEAAGDSGALEVCGTASEFAASISKIAADAAVCDAMGRAAESFANTELSPSVVYEPFVSLLAEHGIKPMAVCDNDRLEKVSDIRNNLLVLTSGGSQLITQIAAMSESGIDFKGASVYYLGIKGGVLLPFLSELCTAAGMCFMGEMPFRYQSYRRTDLLRFQNLCVLLRRGRGYLRHIHETLNPHLRLLQFRHVILSVRHKMMMDPYLVTTLNPERVTFTADGVVDSVEGWSFSGLEGKFFCREIRSVPLKDEIYTPVYLSEDTSLLGAAHVIKDDVMDSALELAGRTPLANRLHAVLAGRSGRPVDAIVFSQHLALSGICSEMDEIDYYAAIVRDLIKQGAASILIKPHPRDSHSKFSKLMKEIEAYSDRVFMLEESLRAVPIEVAKQYLQHNEVKLVTSTSSAPLGVRSGAGPVVCYDCSWFSDEFRREIKQFSERHLTKMICINQKD